MMRGRFLQQIDSGKTIALGLCYYEFQEIEDSKRDQRLYRNFSTVVRDAKVGSGLNGR